MRKYWNKSLEKALRILDCFSRENKELAPSEIAKMLGLNQSSLYPLCSVLQKFNYLARKENGKYSLGYNFIVKSNLVLAGLNLIELARAPLFQLAKECRGNSHLAIFHDWKALIVDRSTTSDRVSINSIIGYEIPLYCTSLGKAILAYLNKDEVKEYLYRTELRKHTRATKVEPEEIMAELEKIRLQGYSVCDDEFIMDQICFASPIFNAQEKVIGAINVAVNKFGNKPEDTEFCIFKVKKAAETISGFLGYMGPVTG
ncbi:MAG: IclR family transcriptional regulator [Firmicutes bacterium]|jgi:DNA-binding IclR family transcriptional regulator|nr:IclR family transcriptional regulator [Bacillota bacterium]